MENLYNILTSTGLEVAYNHFIEPTSPPFITYYRTSSRNFDADNKTYKKIDIVQIELYTLSKNVEAENLLETALNNNDIAYQIIEENYIESQKMYQVIYEIAI